MRSYFSLRRFEAWLHITGDLVELKVNAAAVVGGTSLASGQGRILGSLIGALIIAVLVDRLKIHLLKLKKAYETKRKPGVTSQ